MEGDDNGSDVIMVIMLKVRKKIEIDTEQN